MAKDCRQPVVEGQVGVVVAAHHERAVRRRGARRVADEAVHLAAVQAVRLLDELVPGVVGPAGGGRVEGGDRVARAVRVRERRGDRLHVRLAAVVQLAEQVIELGSPSSGRSRGGSGWPPRSRRRSRASPSRGAPGRTRSAPAPPLPGRREDDPAAEARLVRWRRHRQDRARAPSRPAGGHSRWRSRRAMLLVRTPPSTPCDAI